MNKSILSMQVVGRAYYKQEHYVKKLKEQIYCLTVVHLKTSLYIILALIFTKYFGNKNASKYILQTYL